MTVSQKDVRWGLVRMRTLVRKTHWTRGTYVKVEYLDGDGVYEDGSIVKDTKVIGCLVGLARLVGAKVPTYIKGKKEYLEEEPRSSALSEAIESVIGNTIAEEFMGPGYMDEDRDPEDAISIESWNDTNARTKEQVIELLDAAIKRVG